MTHPTPTHRADLAERFWMLEVLMRYHHLRLEEAQATFDGWPESRQRAALDAAAGRFPEYWGRERLLRGIAVRELAGSLGEGVVS